MPFPTAPPALYFENQAGRLLADAQGFVRLEWLPGSASATAVQAVFEQALRLLTSTGWGRMLINQQHLTPFAPELVQWLLTDWFVRATPAYYRWGAILAADNVFARLATYHRYGGAGPQSAPHALPVLRGRAGGHQLATGPALTRRRAK